MSIIEIFDADSDLDRSDPPRSKHEFPYSYDPFTVWGGYRLSCNASVFSDRIFQWDGEKTRLLGKEIFGRGTWFGAGLDPTKVELFLQRWLDDSTIRLTRVVEYCSQGGFPVWRLDYVTTK
jgi:hypothetical protein